LSGQRQIGRPRRSSTYFTKDIAGSKAAGAVFVIDPKTDVGVSGNMGWDREHTR